jgi:hypothetical protein
MTNDPAALLGKRRTCTRCRRRRKMIAVWTVRGPMLCGECAHTPDVAFAYSLRGAT